MRSTDFPFAVMPQRLQRGGRPDYSAPSTALAAVRAGDDQQFGGISARDTSVRDQIKDKLAVIVGRRNADKLLGVGELLGADAPLMLDEARLAYREGRPGEAAATAALAALPLPGAVKKGVKTAAKGAAKVVKAAEKSLAVNPTKKVAAPPKQLALPAPPKQLALPAPGPGLPKFAAKPRGGQFWADKNIGAMRQSDLGVTITKIPDTDTWAVGGDGRLKLFGNEDEARAYVNRVVSEANPNKSPERAARRIADDVLRLVPDAQGPLSQLQNWFNKAAPKYIKSDFGTPEDPMRALAESGSLHVGLSPDEWSEAAKRVLDQRPIGDAIGLNALFVPKGAFPGAGDDYRANVLLNMPWLQKAPVTDNLYGIRNTKTLQEYMGMGHLLDEMKNALDPRSGLPPELLLRPESLDRMSLPAAAERVGRINQFRVKEMERAALGNLDSPAVRTFKEYPENNPMGLRWTELRAPEGTINPNRAALAENSDDWLDPGYTALRDALKYEGDTMGHCVGGYCDDVMGGRSRIFSLRDAKGEPHVTIETSPTTRAFTREDRDAIFEQARREIEALDIGDPQTEHMRIIDRQAELADALRAERAATPSPDDIVQIKGKQNRAPKDDYLPFVQDFVKSGQWGNVGDLRNARLVKLPDGRYITQQQAEEGIRAMPGIGVYSYEALQDLSPEEWAANSIAFEGYAVGGRVSADRCFSRNPMSVKKAQGGFAVR